MPRKKGSKNKVKKVKPLDKPTTQIEEQTENIPDKAEVYTEILDNGAMNTTEVREKQPDVVITLEEKPEIKENTIPTEKEYISTDEAARLLGVDEKCAQLWFDHGHLTGINELGYIRISRKSIFGDRVQMLAGKSKV